MSGIYLHIPFCKQACSYCDFYFVTRGGESERDAFVDRLEEEIRSYAGSEFTEEPVRTIYFGGGTPSLLLPAQVERILGAIQEVFELDPEEVTFEMNPDDVTVEYLTSLRDLGIDRASMGVQTFEPELLTFMNRAHSRDEALTSLERLHKAGFKTFTVDLIYGNPGQSLQQLESDIETLLTFNPPHISAYSLTVEPKTRLGKQVELGRITAPEDDVVSEHFDLVNRRLSEDGIRRYEVSNYSKPGFEAVHNSNYWNHTNYLGFGPGAHSFWWKEEARRWTNKADLRHYLEAGEEELKQELEWLSPLQLAEERLMMGLRCRSGVSFPNLEEKYGYRLGDRQKEYLQQKAEEGKVELSETLRLTDAGVKLADSVILDLITLH